MTWGMDPERLKAAMSAVATERQRQSKDKLCRVEWCNDKHESKGYCKRHYTHMKLTGDPLSDLERRIVSGVMDFIERRRAEQ